MTTPESPENRTLSPCSILGEGRQTWDNEARPQGAGNTPRPLTRSTSMMAKEGLLMESTQGTACDGTCRPKCRECRNAQAAEYGRKNPHKGWQNAYRSRARKFGFAPVEEYFTREDVIRTYGNACVYCASGEFEELDHFIPVCKEGPHTLANVRPSCTKCNNEKSKTDGCPGDRRL